jgi:hypothetical protein
VISQLFFGIAGHPLETLVRRQIPSALEIKGCDADQGGLEHRSPTLLALSERFHGALALRNEKGRQPDYRDADKCLEARSRWLGHTWQKEGQKRETRAADTNQHDASRIAEKCGQQLPACLLQTPFLAMSHSLPVGS